MPKTHFLSSVSRISHENGIEPKRSNEAYVDAAFMRFGDQLTSDGRHRHGAEYGLRVFF